MNIYMYIIYTVAIEVTTDARPLSLDCNRNALHVRRGTPDGLSTSDVEHRMGSPRQMWMARGALHVGHSDIQTFRHSDI